MAISATMQKAINQQIQKEFASAYLYLSMAAYFEAQSLDGFGHWMRSQAQEEVLHGLKLFDHILDRDGAVDLESIPQPERKFDSPLAAFELAANHEAAVSRSIHDLFELSVQDKDYSSRALVQWFATEQVEEEKTANTIVDKLRLIGDDKAGLYMLDKELGGRPAGGGAAE